MEIKNDRKMWVALGNSRKTKTWKNKEVPWSELLDRFAGPVRTNETVAEYKALPRSRQGEIKDVGGFVGGYCKDGRRADISFRSMLCLDADFASGDLWTDWGLTFNCAAAIYSTHKHTPEKPRLRLVVPLSRNVTGDEYQALGRKVAERLDIDRFDDTTYQPQRVMYWPSCSRDGEYIFHHLDAPFLDVDTVLSSYHDWTDVSSWPTSSRMATTLKRTAAKQKDPLTKKGLVGAFCRAYTIQEAIEAFIPEYQPCDEPGRYTYTEGSTSGGVVVYDDKFTYSHHATDPASGQLCNVWDLVRLHKFRDLDADCEIGTPAGSRPSYKAMSELIAEDGRVKAQVIADRRGEAAEDFMTEETDDSWTSKLKLTEKGLIAQTATNIVTILNNDPKLKGCLAYDDFSHAIVLLSPPPWRTKSKRGAWGRLWAGVDDARLRVYLEENYGLVGKDRVADAVVTVATDNLTHPIRDYLDGCEWDGVPRVETLLIDYLGAEDSPYTRAVTRKTLTAAVARIYSPGCKFDHMLTIQGRQGIGKSTLPAKLAGEWFSDTVTSVQGKESLEQIQGSWIVEIGELAGMRKAEVEAVKLYISANVDKFRAAYERRTKDYPRQCIFIGTTNETQFLRDVTGNRRFWVVDTPNEPARNLWKDLTPDIVKLIWGEAKEFYKKGEKLYLPPNLEQVAREVQESYEEENPNVGIVAEYLDRLLPEDWENLDTYTRLQWLETDAVGTVKRQYVCSREILIEALGMSYNRIDRYALKEARDIMYKIPGWKSAGRKQKRIKPHGLQRYYERTKGGAKQ